MLRHRPLFFSLSRNDIRPFVLFRKESCSAVNGANFFFFLTNFAQTKSSTVELSSAAILLPVFVFFCLLLPRHTLTTSCHYLHCCNVPRSSKSTILGISPVSLSGHVTQQQEDLQFWCHLVPQVRRWCSFYWLSRRR